MLTDLNAEEIRRKKTLQKCIICKSKLSKYSFWFENKLYVNHNLMICDYCLGECNK